MADRPHNIAMRCDAKPLIEPDQDGGEVNESGEVDGSPIVARCEAAEMLEASEASFDPISLGRDHRLRLHLSDRLP